MWLLEQLGVDPQVRPKLDDWVAALGRDTWFAGPDFSADDSSREGAKSSRSRRRCATRVNIPSR